MYENNFNFLIIVGFMMMCLEIKIYDYQIINFDYFIEEK